MCHAQAIASLQVVNILVDPIKRSLAISDTQYGLLQGAAVAIFAAALGLPAARLADRGNRRMIIFAGILGWSTGSALCAHAQSFGELLAGRAVVGIGEIVLIPAALSMLYNVASTARIGTAIGIFGAGGPLGAGLALLVGGWIVSHPDALPLWLGTKPDSWRAAFELCALSGVGVALLVLTIREPLGTAAKSTSMGIALLPHLRERWPLFAGVSGGFIALTIAVFAVSAWAPTFLVRAHAMSYEAAGRATGFAAVACAVLGTALAGVAIDALKRRGRTDAALLVSVAMAALLAVVVWAATLSSSRTQAVIWLCFAYGLLGMPTVLSASALQQISPKSLRAQILALHIFLVNALALSAGPIAVAMLTDGFFRSAASVGYSIGVVTVAACILSMLILLAVRRTFARYRSDASAHK